MPSIIFDLELMALYYITKIEIQIQGLILIYLLKILNKKQGQQIRTVEGNLKDQNYNSKTSTNHKRSECIRFHSDAKSWDPLHLPHFHQYNKSNNSNNSNSHNHNNNNKKI